MSMAYKTINIIPPNMPNSSIKIANIKSFAGSGKKKYFCFELNNPYPNKDAGAMAYND